MSLWQAELGVKYNQICKQLNLLVVFSKPSGGILFLQSTLRIYCMVVFSSYRVPTHAYIPVREAMQVSRALCSCRGFGINPDTRKTTTRILLPFVQEGGANCLKAAELTIHAELRSHMHECWWQLRRSKLSNLLLCRLHGHIRYLTAAVYQLWRPSTNENEGEVQSSGILHCATSWLNKDLQIASNVYKASIASPSRNSPRPV